MSDRPALPQYALSIRQPWAWAIVHGGKDIENRQWNRNVPGYTFRGEFCIHAAKGLTQFEYESAARDIADIGVSAPSAEALMRGGIIGTGRIVDLVQASDSPWFFGRVGLVLADVKPIDFIPVVGALGFFKWVEADPSIVPVPARWMVDPDKWRRKSGPAPIPLFEAEPNQ